MPPPRVTPLRRRLDRALLAVALGFAVGALPALGVAAGCSYDHSGDSISFHDFDAEEAGEAQVIEVGDEEAAPRNTLCGVETHCNPDRADICTPRDAAAPDEAGPPTDSALADAPAGDVISDGGPDAPRDAASDGSVDDAAIDAPTDAPSDVPSDVVFDSAGSGSTSACRVVRTGNHVISACAPAGLGEVEDWCRRDADCAPGLGCVGASPSRCLPFCCGATAEFDPCHGRGRYCTPLPLAAQPLDSVPVCVQPDDCTLLADEEKCPSGTTCTVVTKYGDTTCVPIGAGLDLDKCPCQRGYACLGPESGRVCRKLCHEGRDSECPSGGSCRTVTSIPSGFGICSISDAGTGK